MIKLIVADIDGTLVDDNKNLSDGFDDALEAMNEKGVMFAIASGRNLNSIIDTFPKALNGLILAENGARIRYLGKDLITFPLDRQDANLIIKDAEAVSGVVILYSTDEMQYAKSADKKAVYELRKYLPKYELVDNFEHIAVPPLEISLYDPKGVRENCIKYLYSLADTNTKAASSSFHWLDITCKDADKGSAVKATMQRFGILYEEAAAFGDNYNDIEMLQSVHHSYAMKNAPDDVKRVARYITEKDNNEGGAVKEIIKILENM